MKPIGFRIGNYRVTLKEQNQMVLLWIFVFAPIGIGLLLLYVGLFDMHVIWPFALVFLAFGFTIATVIVAVNVGLALKRIFKESVVKRVE